MFARKALATALILWGGGVLAAPAQEDLAARVNRLEQQAETQTLVDLANRIDSLQQEVQRLRGMVEQKNHAIDNLQRRQRELYLDLDRRLSRLEQAAGSTAAPLGGDAEGDGTEQGEYQAALEQLRELKYEPAIAALRQLLADFPNGAYAAQAQYWIAEASYAQRDFKTAITEYQRLLTAYPKNPKSAEALLKIGASQHELDEREAAVKVLTQLVATYPDSTEAEQARALLVQIKSGEQ